MDHPGQDAALVDTEFARIVGAPDLRSVGLAVDREELRRDIRRIASTIFCSSGIDPSIISFAKIRTALHWGLDEDEVDGLVTARLLAKTASLMAELNTLDVDGDNFQAAAASAA